MTLFSIFNTKKHPLFSAITKSSFREPFPKYGLLC